MFLMVIQQHKDFRPKEQEQIQLNGGMSKLLRPSQMILCVVLTALAMHIQPLMAEFSVYLTSLTGIPEVIHQYSDLLLISSLITLARLRCTGIPRSNADHLLLDPIQREEQCGSSYEIFVF